MAYTYEQFESEAGKAGLLDRFDQQDLIIARSDPAYGMSMLRLMQQSNGAKTAEQRLLADEAATRLRQDYSGYISGGRLPDYADEVVQQSQNRFAEDTAYRRALAQAGGYGETMADPSLTELYGQRYDLEGSRAATNALATASARTGGRPSSYALTLAEQTGNDYKGQLQDTVYEIQKDAYQQALKAQEKEQESENDDNSLSHAEWLYEQTGDPTVMKPYLPYEQYVLLPGVAVETDRAKELKNDLIRFIAQWKGEGSSDEIVSRTTIGMINAVTGRWDNITEGEMAYLYRFLLEGGHV